MVDRITIPNPGESVEAEWTVDGVLCRKLPDDPIGILRVSLGGHAQAPGDKQFYCVFRGDRLACVAMLEKALDALASDHE